MKMKKTLCAVLAAITVMCAFAGCGDSAASSTSDNNSAAAAQTDTTADVSAIGDKLKSDITYEDELVEFDDSKITSILGIDAAKYSKARVYVGSSGATPEEIDCFEAVDETAAADIKAVLEKRVESQKTLFEDYKPEQMDKLNDAVIISNGNYVYLSISNDSAKAKEIIG